MASINELANNYFEHSNDQGVVPNAEAWNKLLATGDRSPQTLAAMGALAAVLAHAYGDSNGVDVQLMTSANRVFKSLESNLPDRLRSDALSGADLAISAIYLATRTVESRGTE